MKSFQLTEEFVKEQITLNGYSFICNHLPYHLYRKVFRWETVTFSLRPSVITRSECELYAISSPRFALRVTFPDGSFANLRRLGAFSKNVVRWGVSPTDVNEDIVCDDRIVPIEHLQSLIVTSGERCIADSMFVVPSKLAEEFFVITTSLSCEYGEKFPEEAPLEGVPFAQQPRVGGGMCAQSVCFNVTTLLHRQTAAIHGIAEISVLAGSGKLSAGRTVRLTTLSDFEIRDYLLGQQLSCGIQSYCSMRHTTPHYELHTAFLCAVRAYLLSRCPVVGLTDTRFLEGPYRRIGSEASEKNADHRSHAILLLGCKVDGNSFSFLMNDPRLLPLMKITGIELILARPEHPNDVDKLGKRRRLFPRCIPVCPAEVQLPLLDLTIGVKQRSFGLFTILRMLRESAIAKKLDVKFPLLAQKLREMSSSLPSKLALIDTRNLHESHGTLKRTTSLPDHEIVQLLSVVKERTASTWLWVQYESSEEPCVLLWDATRAGMASNSSIYSYLVGIVSKTNGTFFWASPPATYNQATFHEDLSPAKTCELDKDRSFPVVPINSSLRPSIISSYDTYRLASALKATSSHLNLSKRNAAIEFYTLMQSERFFDKLGNRTAVSFMASNANNVKMIDRYAEYVDKMSARSKIPIVAFASFIPTISFPHDSLHAQIARDAMKFLYRLAARINSCDKNRINTIEIVSGSRMLGLKPAKDLRHGWLLKHAEKNTFAAYMMSDSEAENNFLANLTMVIDEVEQEHPPEHNPIFAIELEPGPLFTVNNYHGLKRICDLLADSVLTSHVGLNLDISHWRMAGVNCEEVLTTESIFSRIVHAHISGHFVKAHFGDLPPLLLEGRDSFRDWIELLEKRHCAHFQLRYSGYISLEVEAPKDLTWVSRALDETFGPCP